MALKRMVVEIGMGTDIRGADPTKAAVRALRDALWHNSLGVANALGLDTDSMQVEVTIGVPHPEKVDKAQVLAILPHGTGTVTVVDGGLEIFNDEGTNSTLMASAAGTGRPFDRTAVSFIRRSDTGAFSQIASAMRRASFRATKPVDAPPDSARE